DFKNMIRIFGYDLWINLCLWIKRKKNYKGVKNMIKLISTPFLVIFIQMIVNYYIDQMVVSIQVQLNGIPKVHVLGEILVQ
ncbi:hypothetical protein ACJX0J_027295, partial [Zea mays]